MDISVVKWMRRSLLLLILVLVSLEAGAILRDLGMLENGLVRLHVVGASDSEEDQSVKLQVRDAVTALLGEVLSELPDREQAQAYLEQQLPRIREAANEALARAGSVYEAAVSLGQEAFPTRDYETFRLPSGVYETLRVTIGPGAGKNWWCVLYPSLCFTAASEEVREAAADSGFSETLAWTLTDEEPRYALRFRLLDLAGQIRSLFHER